MVVRALIADKNNVTANYIYGRVLEHKMIMQPYNNSIPKIARTHFSRVVAEMTTPHSRENEYILNASKKAVKKYTP